VDTPDVGGNNCGKEMTYRISYEDGWAGGFAALQLGVMRTEYFPTEYQALTRARELVESGVHHAVLLCDSSGRVLAGVPLQLKLGASVSD